MWFAYCRFFLGNPGDYAWGQEDLDDIATQHLNEMDGTGPPPLAKDKIKEIPVFMITQDQVGELDYVLVPWLRISPSLNSGKLLKTCTAMDAWNHVLQKFMHGLLGRFSVIFFFFFYFPTSIPLSLF